MKKNFIALTLCVGIFLIGCSVENVKPKRYGTIKGHVMSSQTQQGIASASVTTNPGTEAVLTDKNGKFVLANIPTGDYLVQVTKDGYTAESVRVTVRKSDTTTAQILLDLDKENKPPEDFIDADVHSFYNNTTDGDTTFVEVNYQIRNSSKNEAISGYEIYFKIYTPAENFLYEVSGDSLYPNQEDIGSFKKYIRDYAADSVLVTDIYTSV